MIDATVNMIVRNGEDYVEASLLSVLPHVKRVSVLIDSRSTDGTRTILEKLSKEWNNLEFFIWKVTDPFRDLVGARNFLLSRINTKFGWIVDSDEVYPEEVFEPLEFILRKYWGIMSYGFTCWAVWDKQNAHSITSNRPSMRIFLNSTLLKWDGLFGREKLLLGDLDLCHDFLVLTFKYIHFTHLKSDLWRNELKRRRRIDINNVALIPMPSKIKKIVNKYVKEKNMQNVRPQPIR